MFVAVGSFNSMSVCMYACSYGRYYMSVCLFCLSVCSCGRCIKSEDASGLTWVMVKLSEL